MAKRTMKAYSQDDKITWKDMIREGGKAIAVFMLVYVWIIIGWAIAG